ncbi:MAG: dTDP-4-dehydrorhamnose reductase [Chloroflexaceae bacterium]|nr:dTDP-4-dehydrorhamnose reductase [Chloroflexaceae bacterium]
MRIALTGANGQLGQALWDCLSPPHTMVPLNQDPFDLGRPDAVEQVAATGADLVIHTAAFTHVDGCARDPDLAYRINGLGTRYVALACQQLDVPMVYISTNEVFSGTATTPYREYDPTGPINAYGHSKWAGEQAVRELLHRFYLVRIAWLFGGERSFVRTVLRLLHDPPAGGLRMVTDEVGSPTYAPDVAGAIARLIEQPFYGTYHLVNAGECSRYAFAQEIASLSGHCQVPIHPIRLADYQRDSTPPAYSPLANIAGAALGVVLRPWQEALAEYLASL